MTGCVRLSAAAVCAAAALVVLAAQAPRPTREDAYRANNLGVARLEQFEQAAAAAEFRRALEFDPRLAIARLNLAIALLYSGSLEQARREAEAARDGLPSLPHPHYVLGLIARGENRTEDALSAFTAVRRMDPEDVGAAINIGQIHLQEGRHAEAREAFREAARMEPYNVTAAYGLATALLRSGAGDDGAEAMRRFQQLRESGYATAFSQNYLEQGRYAEAIASTGAEPDLIDERVPQVVLRAETALREGEGSASPGAVTLIDYDRDGDLDLVEAARTIRVYRNDDGKLTDATRESGLAGAAGRAVLAGDYDNDGLPDLCVFGERGLTLYRQNPAGRFGAVVPPGLAYPHPSGAAAWLDADHDGDLDLYIGGGAQEAPARLFRNNGNGTFADITQDARLALSGLITAAVPTDYDNRRDIDVLVAGAGGAPKLFRNLRDGTFGDAGRDAGLGEQAGVTVIAAGDVNKDGFTDFFLGAAATGTLALSDGRGRFRMSQLPGETASVRAAQFLDYDNDGLLDLLALMPDGLRVVRNLGSRWMDVSGEVFQPAARERGGMSSLAAGDLDGDGDVDLVTSGDRLTVWRNDGGSRKGSLAVRLSPRVSNRSSVGAKIEVRAGSLLQKLEVYAASPAPAPADLGFGLGDRDRADVVRVLWPAGILQAEIPDPSRLPSGSRAGTLHIEELDRKPSSCPYLYTWNGERFEFITDFLGGGEMGYWVAPGVRNVSDSDEYVRIDGARLAPRDGRYELRITNELEEALFLDRAQLVSIDHPSEIDVYPDEGIGAAPRPFKLYHVGEVVPPAAASDDHGHDVLDRVTRLDRRYPDDFATERIRGYAAAHALTLTLPPGDDRLLLLTGWTDYAFSGDNVAAHQAGLRLVPPSLEIATPGGSWRTAIENIGFPAGRPQTVVVDLGAIPPTVTRVRISTTMRIYWDRIVVGRKGSGEGVVVTRLEPRAADLHWRGFSAETTPDGREPYGYDYERVSRVSPWKLLPGRYTREGDILELLTRPDDMFVVSRPGDEIAIAFDAALPSLPPNWTRTFLLYADGFSKEMDLNSSSPDRLEPLPFHGMTRYPYDPPEAYPSSEAHRAYLERYNTRAVSRVIPPLELSVEAPDSTGPASPGAGRRTGPGNPRER